MGELILFITLVCSIIFNGFLLYFFLKEQQGRRDALKIAFEDDFNWFLLYREKLELFRKLGIIFPREEIQLKEYEKKIFNVYDQIHDFIEEQNIIDRINNERRSGNSK